MLDIGLIPSIQLSCKMIRLCSEYDFIEQAEKKCSAVSSKPKSFLDNMQNFFDMQKGGRLTKDLKKLSKKMQG